MNKEIKPSNNSFREHWKLHGYLSPEMIEQLLDKVDDFEKEIEGIKLRQAFWQRQYAR